ncbi:unnamed protein product [Protopolystoma xenopodis]|uniref:Uncharacterized protein n=1 Tax=Protopolystoma xenopodis TaxID=117903 RepID=A0A3S5B912_9PLAT|nr:unnamed protein product [Protopolystoma xenopodis]
MKRHLTTCELSTRLGRVSSPVCLKSFDTIRSPRRLPRHALCLSTPFVGRTFSRQHGSREVPSQSCVFVGKTSTGEWTHGVWLEASLVVASKAD